MIGDYPQTTLSMSDLAGYLQTAIDAVPKAKAMLEILSEQNRFALAFRVHNVKTEAGWKKKIKTFVETLKRRRRSIRRPRNKLLDRASQPL